MTSSIRNTGVEASHRSERRSAAITAMLRTLACGALLMLGASEPSWAEDQTFTVERGTPFPLTLKIPFENFLVDHPDVVDVHSRDDRSVIVEGIATGVSNIVFVDRRSIAIANIRIEVCDAVTARSDLQDEPRCDHR